MSPPGRAISKIDPEALVEMLEIKTNERAKIYQRARAHDIALCWALTPQGPGHV